MVFCDLLDKEENKLRYNIGGDPTDITGVIEIDTSNESYNILEKPMRTDLFKHHVTALVIKVIDNYKRGIIKDKVSYEF